MILAPPASLVRLHFISLFLCSYSSSDTMHRSPPLPTQRDAIAHLVRFGLVSRPEKWGGRALPSRVGERCFLAFSIRSFIADPSRYRPHRCWSSSSALLLSFVSSHPLVYASYFLSVVSFPSSATRIMVVQAYMSLHPFFVHTSYSPSDDRMPDVSMHHVPDTSSASPYTSDTSRSDSGWYVTQNCAVFSVTIRTDRITRRSSG